MICLAFDVASVTGVAVGDTGGKPQAWAVQLGKAAPKLEPPALERVQLERLAKAIRMTAFYIGQFKPDLVAVEAPVGGREASAQLIGLLCCVKGEATRLGVRVVEYYPASIRRHFLGRALTAKDFPGASRHASKAAIKGAVMARCRQLGWDVETGDAADAAALWDYALALESRAHQVSSLPGLFQGVKG